MAQLIRPNVKPEKWILKRQLQNVPLNKVISGSIAQKNDNSSAEDREQARVYVREYCQAQKMYAEAGFYRSKRRNVTTLVIETIVTLARWQQNIKKEAQAIETLAYRIASKVINSPEMGPEIPGLLDHINKELTAMLNWHLAVPKRLISDFRGHYHELFSRYLLPHALKPHERETGAELWINTEDLSFKFDFFDADIDKILCSVQNQLLS